MSAIRNCPSCHSNQVDRAHRKSFERLLSLIRILPYRCHECDRRFYSLAPSSSVVNIPNRLN